MTGMGAGLGHAGPGISPSVVRVLRPPLQESCHAQRAPAQDDAAFPSPVCFPAPLCTLCLAVCRYLPE